MSNQARRFTQGLAGAALLIGVITVATRVAGFARTLSLSHAVGNNCLSTAYTSANLVTNIVFEIVAGGALASMVVPVLAGPAERESADARRIASAMLTWTVIVLVPLAIAVAVLAGPIMSLLVSDPASCSGDQVADVSSRMLVVFAPQILFYGLAVVMYGILQAHKRFLGPALAPLVSSVIVLGAYLSFAGPGSGYRDAADANNDDLSLVGRGSELILSVGTTLGVVALVVTAAWPMSRLRLRLRPAVTFPPGVARRIRRLAMAGLATLVAQQITGIAVIVLANGQGGAGALPVYTYAWMLFNLPYAIFAIPLATSAFPRLSARASAGETAEFDRTSAVTTRVVVLLSCAGAALLAATALPVARVFLLGTSGEVPPGDLARAIVAFAPGLVGYGLMAHLGRTLYAAGKGRASALAQVAGWGTALAAEVVLAVLASRADVVAALGLGNSAGMTVGGILLVVMLLRARGRDAIAGLGRAVCGGLLGAAAGFAAGAGVVAAFGHTGLYGSAGVAMVSALAAAIAFALVAIAVDGRDVRAAIRLRTSGRGSE